jgi:zinc transporter ZupT
VSPVGGVIATLFVTIPPNQLGLLLALFSGFFFYIGASVLVPESHREHPAQSTTLMTVSGAGLLYLMVRLAVF